MIVHVFSARNKILALDISKAFYMFLGKTIKQHFVIVGDKETNTSSFEEWFGSMNCREFTITHGKLDFFRKMRLYRENAILMHGEDYYRFILVILSGCKHINWVCWGSGASVNNNWKSRMSQPIKTLIYKKFQSIVTLMDGDCKSIMESFNVPSSKMFIIPYLTYSSIRHEELSLKLLKDSKNMVGKHVFLLGNNPGNIDYYILLIKQLCSFRGKIEIHCMLNYALTKNKKYDDLIILGQKCFGDDFHSDEKLYNSDEYIEYMNKCDIYMCGNPSQTGLGAIQTCMLLGKKIYLTGKNYEWLTNHYGAKVFKINDWNNLDDIIRPMTETDLWYNRNIIIKSWETSKSQWTDYLRGRDV